MPLYVVEYNVKQVVEATSGSAANQVGLERLADIFSDKPAPIAFSAIDGSTGAGSPRPATPKVLTESGFGDLAERLATATEEEKKSLGLA